ncbi:MAG: oligosaccharide flippase family protein [Planctomycetota bacterium]
MSPSDHDLRRRTLTSLGWQFLGVGGQQLVQLFALTQVWRQLEKEDIGLFGVVLAGTGAIEALTKFMGEETTIWSQRGAERRYLDTVFTVHLLRGLLITGVLCAMAWPLSSFFGDEQTNARYWLPGLFLALAANGLVEGLTSPARALKMKGLAFRQVAAGEFCAVLLSQTLTVTLAFLWQDVWAMVVGHLSLTAAKALISYVIAPYRPNFAIDREVFRELFHYGRGAAGQPFLLLMIFTAPAFVLAKAIGKGAVAVFDGAGRIAKYPEQVFLKVLGPVAFPAYAHLQNDHQRLGRAWLRAVHTYVMLGTPMTVVMAWCGDDLPKVVFGDNYDAVDGLFTLLMLHGGLAGLTGVIGPMLWAVGKPQLDRRAQFFRCVAMYALGIPAAHFLGVTGFAGATCIAIFLALSISAYGALQHLSLPLRAFLNELRDGLLIGAALLLVLLGVDLLFAPELVWRLVTSAVVGGPVLGLLALRLLRRRSSGDPQPPAAPTAEAVVDEPSA